MLHPSLHRHPVEASTDTRSRVDESPVIPLRQHEDRGKDGQADGKQTDRTLHAPGQDHADPINHPIKHPANHPVTNAADAAKPETNAPTTADPEQQDSQLQPDSQIQDAGPQATAPQVTTSQATTPQATIHHFTIPLDTRLEDDAIDSDTDEWIALPTAITEADDSVPLPPTNDDLAETLAELTAESMDDERSDSDQLVGDPWSYIPEAMTLEDASLEDAPLEDAPLEDVALEDVALEDAPHFDLEQDAPTPPFQLDFEPPSLPDEEPLAFDGNATQADLSSLTDTFIPSEPDAAPPTDDAVTDRASLDKRVFDESVVDEELPIFTAESSFLHGALSSDPSLGFTLAGQTAAQRSWLEESMVDAFQGDLAMDDPQAHTLVQQLEQLHKQHVSSTVMAGAYRSLGNLYRDRIEQGQVTPKNLLRAMKAYEHVMQLVTDDSPVWSEVLNDIGNLCWLLSRCAPTPEQGLPHLQQGIQAYHMALTKISPQTHPQTYPMIQNNLGAAYGDLARYHNPFDNLQHSVKAYQEALRYRRADVDPMRFASTQNNLGTTYWNLAQYREPVHNLKQAIAAYSQALKYYQPDKDALNYAMIQNNLGTAYWNLAQHEHAEEWLQSAITAYTIALQYRTLEANPVAYAATQNNLGTAYWHISGYHTDDTKERIDFLRQAIHAYTEALKAADLIQQSGRSVALNFDVLATRNNLGLVQYQLSTDPEFTAQSDDESQYLEQSLDNHLHALQGWQGRPDLRQTAMKCVIQTLKAIYAQKGLMGQNQALTRIPGQLMPEILPQL